MRNFMFIVHGKEKADALKIKYTVLTLDTIKYPENKDPVTLYTVIDTGKLSLESMSTLEQFTNLHEKLIESLEKQQWIYCKEAISLLRGQFGGQVDSFYDHVLERVPDA